LASRTFLTKSTQILDYRQLVNKIIFLKIEYRFLVSGKRPISEQKNY
jgi:hypothetical protein